MRYDGRLHWNMAKKPFVWTNRINSFFQLELDRLSDNERQSFAIEMALAIEEDRKLVATRLFYIEVKGVKMDLKTRQLNTLRKYLEKLKKEVKLELSKAS